MQKFSTLFTFFLILFSSAILAHTDTVTVVAISVKTDCVSGNIHGAELTVLFKKKFSMRKGEITFQSYRFSLHVLNENGKAIEAVNVGSQLNVGGRVVIQNSTNDQNILQTGMGKFFIPYYALKLSEGAHTLKIKMQVARFDSVKGKYDPGKITLRGTAEKLFSIKKPKTRTLKVCCSGVRVKGQNAKGNSWDFGTSGQPDLIYKVVLESAAHADILYVSAEMQNATAAAWIDYAGPVTVSEGDKITIGIYDNDTMFDDIIGANDFSVDELLSVSTTAKELHFGLVEFCTLKVSEIK